MWSAASFQPHLHVRDRKVKGGKDKGRLFVSEMTRVFRTRLRRSSSPGGAGEPRRKGVPTAGTPGRAALRGTGDLAAPRSPETLPRLLSRARQSRLGPRRDRHLSSAIPESSSRTIFAPRKMPRVGSWTSPNTVIKEKQNQERNSTQRRLNSSERGCGEPAVGRSRRRREGWRPGAGWGGLSAASRVRAPSVWLGR